MIDTVCQLLSIAMNERRFRCLTNWLCSRFSPAILGLTIGATVDAQFMVFTILGDAKPASGWPAGATGAMGTITPIESGYYTQTLVRMDGQWLIESLQVRHNLPFAF